MTLGRIIAVVFALAAVANAVLFLAAHRFLHAVANEGSRQRREGGYRLDVFRPYRWILKTWPRRIAWAIFGLVLSLWLVFASLSD